MTNPRLLLTGLLAATCLAGPGCASKKPTAPGKRADRTALPTSQAALKQRVVDALVQNRPGDWLALLPTTPMLKGCPEEAKLIAEFEKHLPEIRRKTREAFERCRSLGDWSKAKPLGERQRVRKRPIGGCQRLIEQGDIRLQFLVGTKRVTVKLDDPLEVDGTQWAIADGLRCRLDRP